MKEETILKMNKVGKVGSIIMLITRILLIIALAGAVAGTIAVVVLPDELVTLDVSGIADVGIDLSKINVTLSDSEQENIKNEISQGNIDIDLMTMDYNAETVSVDEDGFTLHAVAGTRTLDLGDLLGVLIIAVITLAFGIITVWCFGNLCKEFSVCTSPFDEKITSKMQKTAISLIPWALCSGITKSLTDSILKSKVSLVLGIDLGVVLVIVIIFVLVQIFKYGAVLQKESDETL